MLPGRIDFDSIRLSRPAFAGELVWGEALQGIQPSSGIASLDEISRMAAA